MDKIRIKELADQMSLDVKDILNKCKELSIVARTQSSSISLDDANKIKISIVGKPIKAAFTVWGFFKIFTVTSVITPSNPSEPHINPNKSYEEVII